MYFFLHSDFERMRDRFDMETINLSFQSFMNKVIKADTQGLNNSIINKGFSLITVPFRLLK